MKTENSVLRSEIPYFLKTNSRENNLKTFSGYFSKEIKEVQCELEIARAHRHEDELVTRKNKELGRLKSSKENYTFESLEEIAKNLYEKWYSTIKGCNEYINILTVKVLLKSGKQYYYIINSGKEQKVLGMPGYNKILIDFPSTSWRAETLFLDYIKYYNLIEDVVSIQICSAQKFYLNSSGSIKSCSSTPDKDRYEYVNKWAQHNGFSIKTTAESENHTIEFKNCK